MARVGERKRVELQVSSAEEQTARNARRAYAGMAMRTLHKRERSRVYPGGAADGFEIWFTAEWVLRATWDVSNIESVREYTGWSTVCANGIDGVLVRAIRCAHNYTMDTAVDNLRGGGDGADVRYVVIRHHGDPPSLLTPPPQPRQVQQAERLKRRRTASDAGPSERAVRRRDYTSRYSAAAYGQMMHHLRGEGRDDDGVT